MLRERSSPLYQWDVMLNTIQHLSNPYIQPTRYNVYILCLLLLFSFSVEILDDNDKCLFSLYLLVSGDANRAQTNKAKKRKKRRILF